MYLLEHHRKYLIRVHENPDACPYEAANSTGGLMHSIAAGLPYLSLYTRTVCVLTSMFIQSGKMFQEYKSLGQHRLRSLTWIQNLRLPLPVPQLLPSGRHQASTSGLCPLCQSINPSICLLNSRRCSNRPSTGSMLHMWQLAPQLRCLVLLCSCIYRLAIVEACSARLSLQWATILATP